MATIEIIQHAFSLVEDINVGAVMKDIIVKGMKNDEETRKHILGRIHGFVSTSKKRQLGFSLLIKCLPYCNSRDLQEYSAKWINVCVNNHKEDKLLETYLTMIAEIVTRATIIQDFNKKLINEYLGKVVDLCISPQSTIHLKLASLRCLIVCLKHYPQACNVHKHKIEMYLLDYLDNSFPKIVELAAHAFLFLHQVGNAGVEGVNHLSNISLLIRKACASVHQIYDSILQNYKEFENFEPPNVIPLTFSDIPIYYDTQRAIQSLCENLRNCIIFLRIILSKACFKSIYTKDVLDVIRRGLLIHICVKQELSMDSNFLAILFLQIQQDLLNLLQIYVDVMGNNLITHIDLVMKSLLDMINRYNECGCFSDNSLFQETLYNVLCTCLKLSRNGLNPIYHLKFVNFALKSLEPLKSEVSLIIDNGLSKKSSKNKRRAMEEKIIQSGQSSSLLKQMPIFEKQLKINNAKYGLELLKCLLSNVHLNVDIESFKKMYLLVHSAIINIQREVTYFPLDDPQCQVLLYEILPAFYEQNYVKILPPINTTINLLKNGLKNDKEISMICLNGIYILEKLVQPISPSPYVKKIIEGEKRSTDHTLNSMVEDKLDGNEEAEHSGRSVKILQNIAILPPENAEEMRPTTSNHGVNNVPVELCDVSENCNHSSIISITSSKAGDTTTKTNGDVSSEEDEEEEDNPVDTEDLNESPRDNSNEDPDPEEPEAKRVKLRGDGEDLLSSFVNEVN